MLKNKKIIILGSIGVISLATIITTSIFLFRDKEEVEDKEQEKYATKLKNFSQKEITISVTSGTITENKVAILNKLKSLDNFPLEPSGLTLEVKDDSTNLTPKGIAFILLVKKQGKTDIEITGFKVKIIQTDQEEYASKLKNFSQKEVKISATSGNITNNKVAILNKLKSLSNFPLEPSGLTLEIKENSTNLTLEGIAFILLVKKQGKTDIEIRGFKVKRSKSDQEEYASKLKSFSQKEVTISATSGDVTTNKVAIKNQIEALSSFPPLPVGITLEVKDDSTILSLEGIPIILIVKKQGETNVEIRGFKAKRSKTNQEIAAGYLDKLYESYNNFWFNRYPPERVSSYNVKIDATSGTIKQNKNDIINKIKETYPFIIPPQGFDIRIKGNENELVTLEGVKVDIEVFKIGQLDTLASLKKIFIIQKSKTNVEIKNDNYEKIQRYFSKEEKKKLSIPNFDSSLISNPRNENDVLKLIKKGLWLDNPNLWIETLQQEITLKPGQTKNNLNPQKTTIIIEYGPNDAKNEVSIEVRKLSIKQTITNYFKKQDNKRIIIPSSTPDLNNENSILNEVKNRLESEDPVFWKTLKNYLFVNRDKNKLKSLQRGRNVSNLPFKIYYRSNPEEEKRSMDLNLIHLTKEDEIDRYFRTFDKRKIIIPSTTSTLDSAEKILVAIKNFLKSQNSLWTNDHLNKITISKNNETNLINKGDFSKPFIIEYLIGDSQKEIVMLKVKHLSS